MTNETRERINAYKKALPGMRERVVAVALLLAMSVSMMSSASFAWITLSRAPEISGMQTTVAANGNLEIALAQGSTSDPLEAPQESKVGDSSAAEGQSVVDANITWGNLVNVSDPSYGISEIALRPALLSERNVTTYPLYGAAYGDDGRVVDTTDRYEFTSWKDFGNNVFRFAGGSETRYGVRAISSVKYENVTGNQTIQQFDDAVTKATSNMNTIYNGIISNDKSTATNLSEKSGQTVTSISALEALVTVFAQDTVNDILGSSTTTSCSPYIYHFYKLLLLFRDALDAEGEVLLQLANWQAFMDKRNEGKTNTFVDVADLKSKVNELSNYGVKLDTLSQHISDYKKLNEAIDLLRDKALACKDPDNASNPKYTWTDIEPAVSKLINISTTELNGTPMSQLSGNLGAITGGGEKSVVIKDGVLKNFEQRTLTAANRMEAKVSIKVTVSFIPYTVKGVVTTAASGEPLVTADYDRCASGEAAGKGEAVSKDTYGMALDLWVRTNYPGAILTLEGSAVYEQKPVTGTDDEGNSVDIYILSDGEAEIDVYQKDGTWYYANGHTEVPAEALENNIPTQKTEQIVIGYQGENRVWEDWEELLELGYIEKDATTQGAGSCYVFYASPTDQAKILDLLKAFTIAFVDQNGKTLGLATLNTEHAFENNGKVTVPLEMTSGTTYTDENGNIYTGITALTQNEPQLITAIVYLNGRKLENENVLSDNSIHGQLNIQFGTSATLIAPDNEELMSQYRTITAEVTVGSESSVDKASPIQLDYSASGHTARVTLTIDGEQPERIEGFFVRMINKTQGTRGEQKPFTINEDGTWGAEFKITAPGNYVLNTLLVDGVEYSLHDGTEEGYAANHPAIFIKGLELTSVSTDVTSGTYMRTEKSFPVTVTAKIASEINPKKVTALFYNKDQSRQYSALLTYDSVNDQWVGTANIGISDTYILRHISVITDTDTYTLDVPAANQTNLVLYLGLTAGVYTTLSEDNWNYEMVDSDGDGNLDTVTVPIYARVWDGSGAQMKNLTNVTVYYHTSTSAMDADGVSAQLTWTDDLGGYYTGLLGIDKLGAFQANRLTVSMMGQGSALYDLNDDAPVFRCFPPEPPEYVSSTADEYQLSISKEAEYTVYLTNATAATVTGTFTRTDGAGTLTSEGVAISSANGVDEYRFNLTGDGKWKLSSVHVETFDAFDLAATDAPVTKIVSSVNTKTYYDGVENKFLSSVLMEGQCLQTHTSKQVKVEVTDYEGQPIQGLTDATWTINHDTSKQFEYGGYTGSDGKAVKYGTGGVGIIDLAVVDNTVTGTEEFTYTGEYTSTIKLNFTDNQSYTLTAGNPKFTVKSTPPTVTVTGISPAAGSSYRMFFGSLAADGTTPEASTKVSGFASTDYSATVYIYAKDAGGVDSEAYTPLLPKVTLSITGMPTDKTYTATMAFANAASSTYNKTFTFKNSATSNEQSIGGGINGQNGFYNWGTDTDPKIFPAGKQTVDFITVTMGGTTYTVQLSHEVTINQPQYPPYADFAVNDSTFTGTVPGRIYGTPNADGTFTITLPGSQTWIAPGLSAVDGDFELQSDNTDQVWTGSWKPISNGYTTYSRNIKIYTAVSTTTTWDITKVITGWKVGNTTYKPGETVQITGAQRITAVISATNGPSTTQTETATRTVTTFTKTGTSYTEPSGTKVSSTTNTDVTTYS